MNIIGAVYFPLFSAQAGGGPGQKPAAASAGPAEAEIDEILEKSWDHYKNFMIGQGTVKREDIPADQFDKIKSLFVDPSAAVLTLKPGVSKEQIEKLSLPAELKALLLQALQDIGRPYCQQDEGDEDGDGNRGEFITVSEGASYVLLRAAWMNDKTTFDKVWKWTRANLQRAHITAVFTESNKRPTDLKKAYPNKRDHLFAWKYFESVYTVRERNKLTVYNGVRYFDRFIKDLDPAADADIDIAAALLSAYKKWGDNNYLEEARAILRDVWKHETKVVNGKRLLLGSDTQDEINGFNPSYFRWGYYKTIFAELDPSHPWSSELFDNSYRVAVDAADAVKHDVISFINGKLVLGKPVQGSKNLPPDWAALTPDGRITDNPWMREGVNVRFGGDAFRTLFWVAFQSDLDPKDEQARRYLTDRTGTVGDFGPYAFLKQELDRNNAILSGYKIDGSPDWDETLQNNGVYLSYFAKADDRASAKKIYLRMMDQYDKKEGFWGDKPNEYYGQNWIWLSLALLRYGARGLWDKAAPRQAVHLPPVLGGLKERPALLKGFYAKFTAWNFITRQKRSIQDVITNENEGLDHYKHEEARDLVGKRRAEANGAYAGEYSARLEGDIWPKLAEKYALIWLMNKDISVPDLASLDQAIENLNKSDIPNNERAKFWVARLATILADELESGKATDNGKRLGNGQVLARLNKAPFCFDKECQDSVGKSLDTGDITKARKRAIYEKIYDHFIKILGKDPGNPSLKLNNPILKADNLIMRGIIDLDLESQDYVKRFADAKTLLAPFIADKPDKQQVAALEAYRAYLRKRLLGVSTAPADDVEKAYVDKQVEITLREDIASARLFEAQMLMLEASKAKREKDEFDMLERAGNLIEAASPDLSGLKYLSAKKAMAETLARRGFILKNRRDEKYAAFLETAQSLLDDIVKWKEKEGYDRAVGSAKAAQTPRYFRQFVALAHLWKAKISAVELGDRKDQGTREKVFVAQKAELKRLTAEVAAIADPKKSDLKDEPTLLADAHRLLGELKVRLAYVTKDLGGTDQEISVLLASARKHLRVAAQTGLTPVRAEAFSWLAKATLVEADQAQTHEEEMKIVTRADQEIERALAFAPKVRDIKGLTLSGLYCTKGEILLRQGKYNLAAEKFDTARQIYPDNFDALLNLADIRSWQGAYAKAEELYQQVLAYDTKPVAQTKLSDELAFVRARISRYELAMRRDRNYGGAEDYLKKLIASEAPGSALRKRAISALIELYSNRNEWHDRIVTFYEQQLKGKPVLNDVAFQRETLRKVAEAYGWLKQFERGRAVLKQIKHWREDTRLTDAELEMRAKKVKLGIRSESDADPQLGAPVIAAAKAILATRTDDPMLVLKAINALAETTGSEKLFLGMITIGNLLLGESYTPKSAAEKEALAKLTAGLQQLPKLPNGQSPLPLDNKYLDTVFRDFSPKALPKALALAKFQVRKIFADGLMWQKDYKAAIDQLETLVKEASTEPTLTEREKRLIPADAAMKLGEIYRYDLKEEEFPNPEADYFNKSLRSYNLALAKLNGKVSWVSQLEADLEKTDLADPEEAAAVLARYQDQVKALEDDELSALANVYIGRGETRRYAKGKLAIDEPTEEDLRNCGEARKNYLLAKLFIDAMPSELTDEKHLLSAKLHNGLGKADEVLLVARATRAKEFSLAQAAFDRYLLAGNLPPEGGLADEIDRGLASYGSFILPSSSSGGTGYTDRSRRAEQRFALRLELPLEYAIRPLPKELITLSLTDYLDYGNRALLNSIYGEIRVHLFDNEKMGSASVSLERLIYGGYPDKDQQGAFKLVPHPQWQIGASYWGDRATVDASANIEKSANWKYNSYFVSAYWNGASVWTKNYPTLRGFRLGGTYKHIPYYVSNDVGYRTKDTFSLALDYQLDLAEVSRRLIPYSTVIINPYVQIPVFQYAPINGDFDKLPGNYDVNQPFPTGTYEGGLKVNYNSGWLGIFNLGFNYSYSRDFTSAKADYQSWQLLFGWTYVLGQGEKK